MYEVGTSGQNDRALRPRRVIRKVYIPALLFCYDTLGEYSNQTVYISAYHVARCMVRRACIRGWTGVLVSSRSKLKRLTLFYATRLVAIRYF